MRPGGAGPVPDPEIVDELLPEHLPNDQLSIAVFGPGEGEAIVVRLPDGEIGVVDGCLEPKDPFGSGDPVRELLARFEAEPRAGGPLKLDFVCLTHPHDDHFAGMGRLLKAYAGRVGAIWRVEHVTSRFADPLMEWIDQTRRGKDPLPDAKKAKGLKRVIEQMHAAHDRHGASPQLLLAGVPLLARTHAGRPLTVTACGPAPGDIIHATTDLHAALLARERNLAHTSSHDPNLTSGAILARWGASAVLLAGDLLLGKGQHSGWEVARSHVGCEVQVVNVAHHASKQAHDDSLWATMKPALAIVTPFQHAKKRQPPRPEQIGALAGSSVVAITSPPAWDGEPGSPSRQHPRPPRALPGKNSVLRIQTSDARRNAVAVSLDATGKITRFVLAGKADVYLTAADLAPPAAARGA